MREQIEKRAKTSAGIFKINHDDLLSIQIPLPSLVEQRRIVLRLEEGHRRADHVKQLGASAAQDLKAILPSALSQARRAFQDLYAERTVGEVAEILGGGTPSKREPAYWNGTIPWVSPKEMKAWEIADTTNHITNQAVEASAAKWIQPVAVLVVVRGMILARTIPIALSRTPLTINQDMKALNPRDEVLPEFLGYMLLACEQEMLARVQTASHGTRRLPTPVLRSIRVPLPPLEEQTRMVRRMDSLRAVVGTLLSQREASLATLNAASSSLVDYALEAGAHKGLEPAR